MKGKRLVINGDNYPGCNYLRNTFLLKVIYIYIYIYIYNLGGESIVITSLTVENCEESEP